ncbi:ATP-binding protein [Nocardia arthritidis]|uniref:Histidine kinase/HSP90-like ATPase domain-containing protein n=1 Tax=Nocardia arthritidis TaxID=228602 RepID=A0A6G9Y8V4_9NOCA|nr:ATP-binding protein [Nocardia arthritidis]QIS09641.1 hypothetical protein F5544_08695 [Nocardia arthritidis]
MLNSPIRWELTDLADCAVVRPRGTLDMESYRSFRDDLLKFASDQPRAIIVLVDELDVRSEPLLTAFTSAWMRIGDWPSVPIVVVAEGDRLRGCLQASAIQRFIAIYADMDAALDALERPLRRRRTVVPMVLAADTASRARYLVREICDHWNIPDVRIDAQLIITELVENVIRHTEAVEIVVRLELRTQLLTVAVADRDPREAVLIEPDPGRRRHGLHVVAGMARAWGCLPQWPTGKVVWATLPTGPRRQLF